jgi:hypothetical protein
LLYEFWIQGSWDGSANVCCLDDERPSVGFSLESVVMHEPLFLQLINTGKESADVSLLFTWAVSNHSSTRNELHDLMYTS